MKKYASSEKSLWKIVKNIKILKKYNNTKYYGIVHFWPYQNTLMRQFNLFEIDQKHYSSTETQCTVGAYIYRIFFSTQTPPPRSKSSPSLSLALSPCFSLHPFFHLMEKANNSPSSFLSCLPFSSHICTARTLQWIDRRGIINAFGVSPSTHTNKVSVHKMLCCSTF